jgi:hypothetical protein
MEDEKMKNMACSKGLAVIISAVFFVFTCVSVPYAGFFPDTPWEGQIRPGVMVGDNDTQTDYFIDVFLPFWGNEKALVFFNPNYRFDDEDENEWNIGIGTRLLFMDDALIFGGNAYFDTMETDYDNRYQQWGVGLEALSKWVDLRANYYHPYGDTKERVVDLDKYSFASTSILVNKGWEEALEGYDAEIGFLVPLISDYVETRVYGGIYSYDPEVTDDIDGTRFRVEVRPVPLLNLTVEWNDDDIRSTTWFGGYLEIPFSFEELFSGSNPFKGIGDALAFGKGARSVRERMTDKVMRDRHIQTEALVAEDPDTFIEDVVYVNADNTEPGEGTYEDPYQHIRLFDAEDERWEEGTWIYVFSWDDEADQQDDVHFTLLDKMVLWGQGYAPPLFACQLGGGPNPILDGAESGNVITLADYNEIMGLTIQNGEHGIYGKDIKGTYIHNNIIQDNIFGESSGIYIVNSFTGDDVVSGMNLSYIFADNTITRNINGVYLTNYVGDNPDNEVGDFPEIQGVSIENRFSGNTITHNDGYGIYLDNQMYAYNTVAGSDVVASIADSTILNVFTDNDISNNASTGVYIDSNGMWAQADFSVSTLDASVVASVTNSDVVNIFSSNTINNNSDEGVYIDDNYIWVETYADNSASITGDVVASIAGSSITNTFTENDISSNDGSGVYIGYNELYAYAEVYDSPDSVGGDVAASVADSAIANTFSGNTINNNDGDGVDIYENYVEAYARADDSTITGSVTADITNTTITNAFTENHISSNYGDGVYISHNELYADAEAPSSMVDGNVTASISDSAIANTFSGNTINNNEEDGVYIGSNYVNSCSACHDNSTIAGSVTADITGTTITNTFTDNDISDNDGSGVYIGYNEMSANWAFAYPGSSVDGNVAASVADSAIANTFSGNTINNNYKGVYIGGSYAEADGGSVDSTITGSVTADITGTTITNTFTENDISSNDGSQRG